MKVLLADDDKSLRRVLQFKLEKQGYAVTAVADGAEALEQIRADRWDLLLSDIKMPRVDGIELLEQARALQPDLKIILITAHATVSQAVKAVKLGAFDYITKPFDDDQLFVTVEKALAFKRLESENRQLREQLRQQDRTPEPIGISPAFQEMMRLVDRIAPTDATVLLTGASGTGKELVARTIHFRSQRREATFVAVNCAAIPRELIESELFGHVKGAFTGAVRDKKGKFELADGGTILLDEVGELAIDLQAKLLRVLQEQMVEPVGSEEHREINVRIIAATNVDLARRVAEQRFREDLYYRLNVIPVRVPGLKERPDDIAVLAKQFLRDHAPDADISLSPELLARLTDHDWPGNVRELENLVERMVILRQSDRLTASDLPDDFAARGNGESDTAAAALPEHETYHEAERRLVLQALEKCDWNRSKAARYLSIPRHVLIYRMKKYDIVQPS